MLYLLIYCTWIFFFNIILVFVFIVLIQHLFHLFLYHVKFELSELIVDSKNLEEKILVQARNNIIKDDLNLIIFFGSFIINAEYIY
jgi:hypothetical protein